MQLGGSFDKLHTASGGGSGYHGACAGCVSGETEGLDALKQRWQKPSTKRKPCTVKLIKPKMENLRKP